ncbi:MAG: ABC-2 transporter permease, partial [Blautia coccoides]
SEWQELLAVCLAGMAISFFLGSIVIPLLFKFGAEKARALMLAAFLIPVLLCLGVYYLMKNLGVALTDTVILTLTCISPVVLLLWTAAMYRISFGIFKKAEF